MLLRCFKERADSKMVPKFQAHESNFDLLHSSKIILTSPHFQRIYCLSSYDDFVVCYNDDISTYI
jgi:hypothetical protein